MPKLAVVYISNEHAKRFRFSVEEFDPTSKQEIWDLVDDPGVFYEEEDIDNNLSKEQVFDLHTADSAYEVAYQVFGMPLSVQEDNVAYGLIPASRIGSDYDIRVEMNDWSEELQQKVNAYLRVGKSKTEILSLVDKTFLKMPDGTLWPYCLND